MKSNDRNNKYRNRKLISIRLNQNRFSIKKRFYIKRRNRSKIEIDKLREKIRNENLISIPLDQSLDLALFIEKNNELKEEID